MTQNSKSKSNIMRASLLTILAITLVFALTACGGAKPQTTSAPEPKATTAAGPAQTSPPASPAPAEASPDVKAEAKTDTAANLLSEADKVLSLEGYGAKGALMDKNLTIADMLMYAVQDEYLAHGEYKAIIEKFGSQNPFTNIMSSEESHLASLKELYTSYGLKFPEDTSSSHVVIPGSLLQANKTGVQAEIENIAMYERFLSFNLPQPVRDVFEFLKTASGSHLSAFQKQVEKLS